MKPTKQLQEGKSAVELIEEALHLLRGVPGSTLAGYYIGALPFVLAALFFWSDMSRSALAEQRLAVGALGLSLLFFWMKAWQAMFAQELLARLSGEAVSPWTFSRFWGVLLVQGILQPSGLFLLTIAFGILFPFGWIYAFYQNLAALGDGQDGDIRHLVKRAWRQARLWPLQNHYILLLLQPFGLFVFINLITGVLAVPYLLNKLFGIETFLTQSPSAVLNTSFFAGIFALAYLCLDPVVKAIYVLRCFYGESLQTARDLRADLKNLKAGATAQVAIALLLLAGLVGPSRTVAAAGQQAENPQSAIRNPQSSLSPPELDRSIQEVLRKREFTWRMPREKPQREEEAKGAIARFLDSVMDTLKDWMRTVGGWLDDFFRWLTKYFRPRSSSGARNALDWLSPLYVGLIVVAAAVVCALVFFLFRAWRDWHQAQPELAAEAIVPVPDVADEGVGADQLPEDGWIKMARELLEKGELRLALRAFYLASLARLAEGNLITIAKFKSNRDYERELRRRAHALPEVLDTFAENVSIFDRVWYGLHEVNADLVAQFSSNVEKIRVV